MYDRIRRDLKAGSQSLPAVLNINTSIYKSTILKNSTIISNGVVQSKSSLLGSIGNNYCEYSLNVDYYSPSLDYSSSVKQILNQLNNDDYITLSKSSLEDMFVIFEIPDYSAQSMSMRNYDYFVKVFMKDGTKISSKAIMILKSFTMKKAWILVDLILFNNTNISPTDISYCYIDFIYNITNYEKIVKQLKYSQNNNYANLQGLFNTTAVASPYFDQFYYKDNSNKLNVINKQGEYFNYTILDNFTIKEQTSAEKLDLSNLYCLTSRNLTNTDFDFDKFRILYTVNADDYIKSLSYEVYEYNTNSYFGKRCLLHTNSATSSFEIYPVLPDMIHYIYQYEYKEGKTSFDISDIHNELYRLQQYLYNYNFTQVNEFTEDDKNYVEIYIPYHYEGLNVYSEEITSGSENITLTEINIISNDYRSIYDPTRTWQTAYEETDDIEANYIIPYFGNDSYIIDILGDNARIYSNSMSITDIKSGNIFDKYFDILTSNIDTSQDNIITEAYIDGFKNARNTEIIDVTDKFKNIDEQNYELCKNLSYLLPESMKYDENNVAVFGNCFFIYITSADKSLELTFKYDNGIQLNRTYYPYNQTNDKYEYIIPSESNLNSITSSKNIQYSLVY